MQLSLFFRIRVDAAADETSIIAIVLETFYEYRPLEKGIEDSKASNWHVRFVKTLL